MARVPTPEEAERIRTGPRFDPGKPRAPWGKRVGDGTITSTPRRGTRRWKRWQAAKKAAALRPTLEPVIPQPKPAPLVT